MIAEFVALLYTLAPGESGRIDTPLLTGTVSRRCASQLLWSVSSGGFDCEQRIYTVDLECHRVFQKSAYMVMPRTAFYSTVWTPSDQYNDLLTFVRKCGGE